MPALRLGLHLIKGFTQRNSARVRQDALFHSMDHFCSRLSIAKQYRQQRVQADALHYFNLYRYQILREIKVLGPLGPWALGQFTGDTRHHTTHNTCRN
jgi:hypothetical protein